MEEYFLWYKALHVISVIAWMAGIFYMPRLFVYHTSVVNDKKANLLFKTMERRLFFIIMTPAMVLTYIFGFLIAYIYGWIALGVWFHIKLFAVLLLTIFHFFLAKWMSDFNNNKNLHSEKFYRLINEIPTILMVIIVVMVVVKPFE